MQLEILQKQLQTSIQELKTSIQKFEKHPSPSTHYAEQLHDSIHQVNKYLSAFLVLKEHKDVSPDLNLHLKLMNVPVSDEKTIVVEPKIEHVVDIATSLVKEEVKPIEIINAPIVENVTEKSQSIVKEANALKELSKITISINDKFRFINELFSSNVVEYNIAIEQINAIDLLSELNHYLNGLLQIYAWKEDNEVVKHFFALAQKRFS